jgi:hypothetical protein
MRKMNLIVREIERALAHAKNRSTARPSTDNVVCPERRQSRPADYASA